MPGYGRRFSSGSMESGFLKTIRGLLLFERSLSPLKKVNTRAIVDPPRHPGVEHRQPRC